MTPFLQQTARYMVSTFGSDLEKVCVVLPNRRAGLFLRRYLAEEIGRPVWSPAIFSVEDFIREITGLVPVDPVSLLLDLYTVYCVVEGDAAKPFEEFLRWAPQLVSDFDEVDRYLADPDELFSTLTEARAIALWNPDGRPLTEFEQNYLRFYRSLSVYHRKLKERLLAEHKAWQGLAFRMALERIGSFLDNFPWKHCIFAGFNALTGAEEKIITALREAGRVTLLWDADHYYLQNRRHEAGDFLRRWMGQWPDREVRWISEDFATGAKEIDIIGAPDPVGQVKYCSHLLQELAGQGAAGESTAVVLLDQGLLMPLLNSIPPEVETLNITAGISLAQTPMAGLFNTLFGMHLHGGRTSESKDQEGGQFYYRDVLDLLRHPYIRSLVAANARGRGDVAERLIERIRTGTRVFIGLRDLSDFGGGASGPELSFLKPAFLPWNTPEDALTALRAVSEALQAASLDELGREYLFEFATLFNRLGNLIGDNSRSMTLHGLQELFRQALAGTSLPFSGEPLKGLQIMGMLETRALDFDRVILLSCNEDLLPGTKSTSSFIPFDIKRDFGLPTYRHKDSVYAYHFYRLIQRAGRVWILYNTEPDQLGGGEQSRYLRQLVSELPVYNSRVVIRESVLTTPPAKWSQPPPIVVEKTEEVARVLLQKAEDGFSATSLNAYRNCPMKFCLSEIKGIREPDEVGDRIDHATLGTAVHGALEQLFLPEKGVALTRAALEKMENRTDEAVDAAFGNLFKGAETAGGENLLMVTVAKLMVKKLLRQTKDELPEEENTPGHLTVEYLEERLETIIPVIIREETIPVRLKGYIDRIDNAGSLMRIIDYKTGTVQSKNVAVTDWDLLLTEPTLNYAFQLLVYGFLLEKKTGPLPALSAGILSLKKSGTVNLVSVPDPVDGTNTSMLSASVLERFGGVLQAILAEIFDRSLPFVQTEDQARCVYCPYTGLCGR